MANRYVKMGQYGKSYRYTEINSKGETVPAFETDGICSFAGTIIISPTTTIVGASWRYAAYYDSDNFVRCVSNTGDTSGWTLDFYVGGVKVAEAGMDGVEIIGLVTEMPFAPETNLTARDSKHGELEYDSVLQEWHVGVPNADTPNAPFVKVANITSAGHLSVYQIQETGVLYTSAGSPIFVGVPYGWTPPLGALEGYTDLTSDMNHTALRFERTFVSGDANAILKTKVVSEGVSF